MKLALITGISRGLGKALVQEFIANEWQVWGIGRTNSLNHPALRFIPCDLADTKAISKLVFDFRGVSELILINNAGVLGEVMPLANYPNDDNLEWVYQVNVFAPISLSRKILEQQLTIPFTICNISSGAGRRPISSWSLYGSSKAAIDHFSLILQQEELESGRNTRVYALAPGVIDTEMQGQIRQTPAELFSAHEQFVQLSKNNLLQSPKETAQKIFEKLTMEGFPEVLCRLN